MAQEPAQPPVRPSGFRALMRNRDYALLWTSQGISLLGDRFHWVAISLWVYATTGSALSVSYAVIALMLGPAAVGLFAGVLVDRWNRKWTMIIADIIRGVLVALIPRLMVQDIRLVYVDLFLVSCASAFFRPAMLATIPQTVAKDDLMPANSFFTSVDTATDVVGPVLAGLAVQAAGYGAAMYVDSASYLASAVLISLLSAHAPMMKETGRVFDHVATDIKQGFDYIRRDRIQLGLMVLIFLAWWTVGLNSLQTPLAKGELSLSDREFGWFNGIWGVGFLVASLVLGWYGRNLPKGRLLVFGFASWIIASGVTASSLNAGMLYVTVFWVGFTNVLLVVTLATVIMQLTPSPLLGRVLASRQVAFAVVKTIAMLGFGWMADIVGVRSAIATMASVSLMGLCVGVVLFPEILRLDAEVTSVRVRPIQFPMLSVVRRVFGIIMTNTDPAYPVTAQRNLNFAVLPLLIGAWILALIGHRLAGLYFGLTFIVGAISVLSVRILRGLVSNVGVALLGSNKLRQASAGKEEIGPP